MAAVETVDLSAGGLAVIILNSELQLPVDYAFHRQILALSVDQLDGTKQDIEKKIPPGAKVVLLSDGIPGFQFQNMRDVFQKRGIPYLTRRNQAALEETLKELNLPMSSAPQREQKGPEGEKRKYTPKGATGEFVTKHADLRKGAAEEARRLVPIARQEGLDLTFGALSQAISIAKRKGNFGSPPKSVLSPQQQALRVLDEAIENLNLIRDYVQETEAKNTDLEARLKKIQDAIGVKA